MLGDLFNAGAKLLGGAGNVLGSVFGAAAGMGAGGAAGGASLMNVAMNIFGGRDDDPWGFMDSPVTGHVLSAVGQELMRGDPVEERLKLERSLREDRRRELRGNYGLPSSPGANAARYQRGNGLMPTRGIYTPPR